MKRSLEGVGLAPDGNRGVSDSMVCHGPSGADDDKKKAPVREKQTEAEKEREEKEAEEGVDTANDFMKKFLKKSEG